MAGKPGVDIEPVNDGTGSINRHKGTWPGFEAARGALFLYTAGTGYTNLQQQTVGNANNVNVTSLGTETQIVSATGSYTASLTLSAAMTGDIAIVTFGPPAAATNKGGLFMGMVR